MSVRTPDIPGTMIKVAAAATAMMITVALICAGCAADSHKHEKEHIMSSQSGKWSPELSAVEEAALFQIADDTLKWCVKKDSGDFSFDKYDLTEKLKIERATFVTLKINGMLRGCIGSLVPVAPLYKSVHDNAVNAALHDPRFSPVSSNEVSQLEVHISVLSPITPIKSLDEFRIGEHGIILTKGYHRAVYLPEVAVEQHWSREETLSSLSVKAGLAPDAWKSGASFEVFSSVSIESEQ